MKLSSRKNGSFKEIFKLTSAYGQGCSLSYSSQCPKVHVSSNVMGNANEAQVSINGIEITSLLNTGVSTVSKSFYDKHLSHLELLPHNSILKLECADRQLHSS